MKIHKLNLTSENLFLVDQFFKVQFKGNYRYGQMGYFYWKLLKNKTSNGFINSYIDKDKIIATTSIVPKTILYKSKEYLVAEICDGFVDQKYQGKGLFINLIKKSKKDAKNFHFIYGTPNHLSLPVFLNNTSFQKINFFEVYSFIYPLSIKKKIRKRIGNNLASFINIFYKFYVKSEITLARFRYNFSRTYTYKQIDSLDESFNIFWNKASKEWDFIFIRNKKMLSWRFDENPTAYNKIIFKKDSITIGYIVYTYSYEDDSRIIIADFLFLKGHYKAFDYSLFILKEIALKKGISGISLWNSLRSGFTKILFKNRFYKNNEVPIIVDNGNNEIMECKNVHFTISDSDNI